MDDDSITDMHGDLQHLWVSVQLTTCRGRWHKSYCGGRTTGRTACWYLKFRQAPVWRRAQMAVEWGNSQRQLAHSGNALAQHRLNGLVDHRVTTVVVAGGTWRDPQRRKCNARWTSRIDANAPCQVALASRPQHRNNTDDRYRQPYTEVGAITSLDVRQAQWTVVVDLRQFIHNITM